MANVNNQKTSAPASKKTGFLKGIRAEFKKIIWPTKEETMRYTLVVVVISVIVALFVYGMDLIFTNLLNLIIK